MELAHRWVASPLLSIETLERLLGLVVFLSAGFKVAQPDVAYLFSFLGRKKQQAAAAHTPRAEDQVVKPPRVQAILELWKERLKSWNRKCVIVASFSPVAQHDRLGFVDAATLKDHGWGAVFIDTQGSAFLAAMAKWTTEEGASAQREERMSTGELEIKGIVHWLVNFGARCVNKRVLLLCDNMSACQGMASGFSGQEGLAEGIRLARQLVCTYNIVLRVAYISTHANVIADALSHDDIPQAQCHALAEIGRPFKLLRSRQNGAQPRRL